MEVTQRKSDGEFEPAFDEVRERFRAGDNAGAIELATAIANRASGAGTVGRALMLKTAGMVNLGRFDECPPVLDRMFSVLEGTDEHGTLGGVHAMASFVAYQTSVERCVHHLVLGWRALEMVTSPGLEAVDSWLNIAVSFSYTGFHVQAVDSADRCYALAQSLGLPKPDFALVEVGLRQAVARDHQGDAAACASLLRHSLRVWSQRTEPGDLWCHQRAYFGYATVRLAILGERIQPAPELVPAEPEGWELVDLRLLTDAGMAIIEDRPADAVSMLEGQTTHPFTLGAAEIHRVLALAYSAAGDDRAALEATRECTRLACQRNDRLRDRLVDGVRMWLDHESLRHKVERYASEALTDPLTGLPNRRHFERMIAREDYCRGVLGVIDLDNFKVVNTVHGHSGGDLVLQRVAAILAREIGAHDFIARYGGDEFVVMLSETDLSTAHSIGVRLCDAVASENWSALVADTPVSITIGWTELGEDRPAKDALAWADRGMLARKQARSACRESTTT